MNYTSEQLKKLHEVELSILCEIDRVCKENNINYYLDYGTLLGAVRHKGFIPWDDDIDISMLRNDYEKFIKIAPEKLKKGFILQHYSIDKNVVSYHAKVRKEGTLFIEEAVRNIPVCHGIFVDIFPCDKISESKIFREIHYKKINIIRTIFISKDLSTSTSTQKKGLKIIYSIIRAFLHLMCKIFSKDFLYNLLNNAYQRYNDSNSCLLSEGTKKATYPKSSIVPFKQIEFENKIFSCPNNTDEVLKHEYGNYMKLPPIDKRISHVPIKLEFESENNAND